MLVKKRHSLLFLSSFVFFLLSFLHKIKKKDKKKYAHKHTHTQKKEPKKPPPLFKIFVRLSLSLLSIDERGACDVLASSGCVPRREVSSATVRGKRRGRGGRGGGDAGRVGVFHLSELQARDDENDETTTRTTSRRRRQRKRGDEERQSSDAVRNVSIHLHL